MGADLENSMARASPLLKLPTELLLTLLETLDVREFMNIRQCNRMLLDLTREHALWVSLLRRQSRSLPLPSDLFSGNKEIDGEDLAQRLSTQDLEQLVAKFHRVNRLWPQPREKEAMTTFVRRHDAQEVTSLLGLQVFLDRWLLALYTEGVIEVYDLQAPGKPALTGEVALGHAGWGSYAASFDESTGSISIAIGKTLEPFYLDVWKIALEGTSGPRFQLLQRTVMDPPKSVRAIEPSQCLVALSALTVVELMSWKDPPSKLESTPVPSVPIPAYPRDPEDFWNGILTLRFIGSFLLIAKARSLELHHYLPALQPSLPRLSPSKHHFGHLTFREVAFSHCRNVTTKHPNFGKTVEIVMLGSDVIQGLFQFLVKIHIPHISGPSTRNDNHGTDPYIEIELIGVYPLSLFIAPLRPVGSPSNVQHGDGSNTPTPLTSHAHHYPNGFGDRALATITRGFLSTFCIGPQGKRAIWVERARSSISREVQVWDHQMESRSDGEGWKKVYGHWTENFGEKCAEMEKTVVYRATSYDLRDDIMHCAFGETMGTIVLGTRSGSIHVLPLALGDRLGIDEHSSS